MPRVKLTSDDSLPVLGFTFPKLLEITGQCATGKGKAHDSQSIVAVVMAAATLEAFITDLVGLIEFTLKPTQKLLGELASELNGLEENRKPLAEKYEAAKEIISTVPFDKGQSPYQDFQLLLRIRNQLMHPKVDLIHSDREGYILDCNSNQEIVEILASKGFCEKPVRHRHEWFTYFENAPSVATWAYDTASAMILEIFQDFPKNSIAWLVLHSRLRDIGLVKGRERGIELCDGKRRRIS